MRSRRTRGAPANPILQGQHPEYLYKHLTEYKSGKRANAIMQGMVAALSDDDKRQLAWFYASKPPVPGAARNKETVALGESIWRGGIPAKGVPACAACICRRLPSTSSLASTGSRSSTRRVSSSPCCNWSRRIVSSP